MSHSVIPTGGQQPDRPTQLSPPVPHLVLSMARTAARALGTPVEVWAFPGSVMSGGCSGWQSAPAGDAVAWPGTHVVLTIDALGNDFDKKYQHEEPRP